jgi:hypothetical protein
MLSEVGLSEGQSHAVEHPYPRQQALVGNKTGGTRPISSSQFLHVEDTAVPTSRDLPLEGHSPPR